MKKVKTAALILASVVMAASAASAAAGADYSGLKNYLMLDSDSFSGEYDINDDGKTDVFDVCHLKQQILYETEKPDTPESFFSLGEASIDSSEKKIYIPLVLSPTDYYISKFSLELKFDSDSFLLSYLNEGDMCGQWSWSVSEGNVEIEYITDETSSYGGTAFIAEYDINEGVPEGYYEFSVENIRVTVTDDSGEERVLTAEECPENAGVSTVYIDNTVSPPVVTDPPVVTTPAPVHEAPEIYNAMIALKKDYPDGTPWTNDNGYAWNGGIYSMGYGCAGFAFMLSDAAFGNLPARIIEDWSNYQIRVGDILRVNNDGHSVIVLEVNESGVVLAEGNYNNSVHWGRKMSWSEVNNTLTYIMTRYPE
ncbi:MAG: hypothetical protein Q4D76_03820 [Oscillospiraceae bacterium]|nr:hypothetical protein [Oscillospiraceae bacterium]